MYCYQCGVELAEGERKCPLCGTEVPVRPDREKEYTYPPGERITDEKVSRGGAVFVLSVVFLIPFVITLLCDAQINGGLTWGGYASGAIFVLYVIAVLPVWFRQPNPVIFLAADFIAAGIYLAYINWMTDGSWFWTFALPVTFGCMAIAVSVTALVRYVRRGFLYIYGGAAIAAGGFCILIEFLLNQTFGIRSGFAWSLYPCVAFALSGIAMIVIGAVKPLRESLHKRFFIS